MSYELERRRWGDLGELIGRDTRGVHEIEQERLPGA